MSWLTLPDAFCKPRNTPQAYYPESQACLIFSVISISIWVVELLCLNPNCSSNKILFELKNSVGLACISFSIILVRLERS